METVEIIPILVMVRPFIKKLNLKKKKKKKGSEAQMLTSILIG